MEQEPVGYELHPTPSFWLSDRPPRVLGPPLRGCFEVDVAVVGAGLCGLWTAAELLARDPQRHIAVIDADRAGAIGSASMTGCSSPLPALIAGGGRRWAEISTFERTAGAMSRRLADWEIDAELRVGSSVALADDRRELSLLGETVRTARLDGATGEALAWVEPEPLRRRPALQGVSGMLTLSSGVSLHPGRLVDGMVDHLRANGVSVFERSPVVALGPNLVQAESGWLSARAVVAALGVATGAMLPAAARHLPTRTWYHLVTHPVDELSWERLGWPETQSVFADDHSGEIQARRSADGRLVWSWSPPPSARRRPRRGAASLDGRYRRLLDGMARRLPGTVRVEVAHRWSTHSIGASDEPGLGRSDGVYWLVSPSHDPLVAAERGHSLSEMVG